MQPLKMLPKPFKAATTNNGMNTNLNAVAAAVNSTFSMLSAVPQSSFYNMMHGSKQLVQSKLKQTYSGSLFCILQDQNFHTSTAIQKEEKGTGNGMDKGGANNNDNLEGETISESILEFEPISKAGVRRPGRGPLCKCGRPLRKLQSTLNNNEFILECTSCGTLYDSGGSSMDSTRQEIRRRLDEIDKCPTPKQMTAYLDKFVIGQDGAKRDLSLGVYEHYIRIGMNDEFRQKRRGNQIHQGSLARQLISNHLVAGSPTISFERLPYSNDVTKQQQQQKPKNRSLPFQFDVGKLAEGDFVRMDKSNILLLGPSGVGKTYMIKILAEYLKVPMAHSDCTSMTQAGYVGEDVESVLTKLLQEADGNVTKAEMGIVFLDEIDKIASTREFASTSYRDVSGEGVQHAMLKMIEGTIVNVKSGKKCNQFVEETVQVDTSDILFIGSGAFTGIDKQISRRLQKLTVGFGAAPPLNVITQDDKEQEVINEKRDRLLKEVQADDVIKFGMIPELVGRFPIRVPFYSLNKELLKRVMMEPEHSMLAQARVFFKLHDAKLEFTDEALDEIAGKAIKDKTGARALISILNEVLKDAKYNLPGAGVDTVRITGEFIRGESNYEVIMKSKARQHPQVIHLHAPTVAAAV